MAIECKHGQLKRQCLLCEYEERIAKLEAEREKLKKYSEMILELAVMFRNYLSDFEIGKYRFLQDGVREIDEIKMSKPSWMKEE